MALREGVELRKAKGEESQLHGDEGLEWMGELSEVKEGS
jgi:hypothetical protein